MQDWRDGELRYLIHFDDGGSGMRTRDEPPSVIVTVRYERERGTHRCP